MAKSNLVEPFHALEREVIATLISGLNGDRPDLSYPASFSDMQSMVRELLCRYNVEKLEHPRGILYEQ